jgi:hypothetical protein
MVAMAFASLPAKDLWTSAHITHYGGGEAGFPKNLFSP